MDSHSANKRAGRPLGSTRVVSATKKLEKNFEDVVEILEDGLVFDNNTDTIRKRKCKEGRVGCKIKEELLVPVEVRGKNKKANPITKKSKLKWTTVREVLLTVSFEPIKRLVDLYETTENENLKFRIAREILQYVHAKPTPEGGGNVPVSFNIMIAGEQKPQMRVLSAPQNMLTYNEKE